MAAIKKTSAGYNLFAFLVLLIIVCLFQAFVTTESWQRNGVLGPQDTDPWLRLVKVQELYETGEWNNHHIQRMGQGQGLESHWTRPLDVLLIASAAALTMWVPFKEALFLVVTWGNAVLLFALACSLLWAMRPIKLRWAGQLALGLGVVVDPLTGMVFAPGRLADHHSLLAVMAVLLLGCMLRLFRAECTLRIVVAAGLVAGCGVWLSPEFLASVAVLAACVAVWWAVRGEAVLALRLTAFFATAAMIVVVAVFCERPLSDFTHIYHDRVSWVHVVMLSCAAALSFMLLHAGRYFNSPMVRTCVLGVLAVLSLFVLNLLFPQFYLGPMAGIVPEELAMFNRTINELASGLSLQKPLLTVSFYDAVLVAAVMLGLLIASRDARANHHVVLLAYILVFSGLVAYQLRWNYYLLPVAQVGVALLADRIALFLARRMQFGYGLNSTLVGLLLCSSCAWPALIMPLPQPPQSIYHQGAFNTSCSRGLARIIQTDALSGILGKEPKMVLTAAYISPQVLYWTPHRSIASYYHTDMASIIGLNRFFYSTDEHAAKAFIEHFGVDVILLCSNEIMKPFDAGQDPESLPFIDSLRAGQPPAWLQPVLGSYPKELLFYRVVK